MSSFQRILTALLALAVCSLHAQSELDITWGTSAIDQKIITSDGTALAPGDYIIEIGYFDSGFIPTDANIDQWQDNWVVFDAITTGDSDPSDFHTDTGNDGTSRFAGSAHLLADQTSDSEDAIPTSTYEGQQAYVFIREDTDYGFYGGVEWALYTNETGSGVVSTAPWVFPSVDGGQQQFPLNWFVSAADTAVVGAVGDSNGITDTGGGTFTDTSEDFIIRTHTVIPEPNLGLLLGSLGLLFLVRRGRGC